MGFERSVHLRLHACLLLNYHTGSISRWQYYGLVPFFGWPIRLLNCLAVLRYFAPLYMWFVCDTFIVLSMYSHLLHLVDMCIAFYANYTIQTIRNIEMMRRIRLLVASALPNAKSPNAKQTNKQN